MIGCLLAPFRALFSVVLAPLFAAGRGCMLAVGCAVWIVIIAVALGLFGVFNVPFVPNLFGG